ncbi:hypothetical protein VNO77_03861 [Canavalia gladiata]|uniref:Uncharacterized protein n=1 Tax=Canavalia gladiata TaxID=3824 RepID=A0AAN9N1X9_CANGL
MNYCVSAHECWISGLIASSDPLKLSMANCIVKTTMALWLLGRENSLGWHEREEFLPALKDNQTLICAGETGSGKTTQTLQLS